MHRSWANPRSSLNTSAPHMMRTAGTGKSDTGDAEMGAHRQPLVLEIDHLHRRVEMGARLQIGPGAVLADLGLDLADLAGESPDGVIALGVQVRLPRRLEVPGRLEPVAFVLVATAHLRPDRDPFVLGGPLQPGHRLLQLLDVVDHREPAAVEPAMGDDERVLVGSEAQIGLSGRGHVLSPPLATMLSRLIPRSSRMTIAALRPGPPVIEPPGWVVAPVW